MNGANRFLTSGSASSISATDNSSNKKTTAYILSSSPPIAEIIEGVAIEIILFTPSKVIDHTRYRMQYDPCKRHERTDQC